LSVNERVTVVLVDDDPDEHFLFKADLEDAGVRFEFEAFTRPEDALLWLRSAAGRPVLLLTDLSLGGHDAMAFIVAAQELLGGGAMGVYSGTRNPEVEAKCREAGASFYIVKPVTRKVLEDVIAGVAGFALTDDGDGLWLVGASAAA
jgi:CheY-like chemotaxis protein